MADAENASRWLRPWRPAQPQKVVEHDAADLGTCFGLDMSLEQAVPHETAATPHRTPWWAPWSNSRPAATGGSD
jgi:hypothetical protein